MRPLCAMGGTTSKTHGVPESCLDWASTRGSEREDSLLTLLMQQPAINPIGSYPSLREQTGLHDPSRDLIIFWVGIDKVICEATHG